jgi:hypothetical protein
VLTVIAVVASANHFILDCVAGAGCTALAFLIVGWWDRRRRRWDGARDTSGPEYPEPPALAG